MRIETERLIITDLTHDMAEAVHLNSLDEDVRRFVPDEVFETLETAREVVSDLIECYDTEDGPVRIRGASERNRRKHRLYTELSPLVLR